MATSEKIITPADKAARMVREHLALDIPEALTRLQELDRQARESNLLILYTDIAVVRGIFNEKPFKKKLLDEQPYAGQVRAAFIPSGYLARTSEFTGLVFGKIIEFVPKGEEAGIRLAVLIKDFPYEEKQGIFFTSDSAEEVAARGSRPFVVKHPEMNLRGIEFNPISGDFILGIFSVWNHLGVSENFSLVLWMPRNKALFL